MDIVDSNSMLYVHIYLRLKRRGREKCVHVCVWCGGIRERGESLRGGNQNAAVCRTSQASSV